jgi:hypothetical protein
VKLPITASRLTWLTFTLFFTFTTIQAQEKSGSIAGTVSDDSDAVLPGVTVALTNKSTHRITRETTGSYGNYTMRDIEPGEYSVVFTLSGFTRTEVRDVEILVAQNRRLDVRLKPGAPSTIVQVTDTLPLLDTQSSSMVLHVPQDDFDRLPKGRTVQQLANLASSVNAGEIEGGIQINGASGAENAYLIDGVATQSAIVGRSRQDAVFEYVQEMQIQTSGVPASYSGALGGVISSVTRSGGNQFHGSAWLYYSADSLAAAPPPRLVLNPSDNRSVGFLQDEKNAFRKIEPGFSLGGPILLDRLYFYTAWSPQWVRQDQLYHFSGGSETGTIQRNQTFMSGFNKLSYESKKRVRLNFTWLWTPSESEGTFPVYNASCPNCISSTMASNDANKQRGYFNPQSTYGANLDFPIGTDIVVSSRGSYFWDNFKDTGIPDITSVQYGTPALGPLVPPLYQGPAGFQNTPAILKYDHDLVTRATGQLDISIYKHFMGTHSLKAGIGVEKTVNNVNGFYPGGYANVWWDSSFTSLATGVTDRGPYGYYEVNDFRTFGSAGGTTKSFYIQDTWNIENRLTLNVGLRMEDENVPSFRRDIKPVAIDYGWKNKISPRVGAAYDLFADGRLKLFGSWGRYFDPTRFQLAREVFGAETWRTYYRSLDDPNVFVLNLNNMPGRDLWNPAVPNSFRDRRNATAGLASIAPDLKPMSQNQFAAGVDYQWNTHTVLGVHYIRQSLIRTIEDLAVLVQGNAAYIYANPSEGIAVSAPFVTGQTSKPLDYPKPVRDYDALEVSIAKRFGDHWFGKISYTWSRLYGNYSGPASSDELLTPTTGLSYATAQEPGGNIAHPARNANYSWDLDEILFDSKGNLDTRGRLATDRTHVFKLNGGYEFEFGRWGATNVGTFVYLGSGTPLSTVVHTLNTIPALVNGRGDMGRTPFLSSADLQVAHTIPLTEVQKLRIEMNILNVFNQKTTLHRFDSLNRGEGTPVNSSAINLSSVDLRKGYDYNALIQATPDGADAFDPRYGMDDFFSEGLTARFSLKWSF